MFPKYPITVNDLTQESSEPSKVSVVSSAYWLNLNSVSCSDFAIFANGLGKYFCRKDKKI